MIELPQPAVEFSGREWQAIEGWLKEQQATVYKLLANPATTDEKTQQLRGRASLIQEMLDWKDNAASLSRVYKQGN